MKKPEDFTGTDVEGFLIQCTLYILGNPRKFPDDNAKILLALSCCKKDAAEWAKNFAEEAIQRPRVTEEITFGTFENFKTLIKGAFGDPNKQQTAQLELSLFRQKDDMTAVEFFSKFDILVRKAGYSQGHDEYLIQLLEHNLQIKLVEKVTMLEIPENYKAFKERARRLDAAWRRQQTVFKDRRRGTMPVQNRSPQAAQPQTQQTTVQTTRDSTGVTFGGQGQMMDLDKARRLGVCMWCGKTGHIARFCPNRGPRRVRQVDGAEVSTQPVTATITEVVAEAAKPPDANELLMRQLTSMTDLLKNLSDRVSSIENQGFGKSQR